MWHAAVFVDLPVVRGRAMRCTGLVAVRPAHSTSGASSTTASGPVTSVAAVAARGDGLGLGAGGQHLVDGGLLEAVQQLADRLVDRVMPATDAVPGMMQTWSAS